MKPVLYYIKEGLAASACSTNNLSAHTAADWKSSQFTTSNQSSFKITVQFIVSVMFFALLSSFARGSCDAAALAAGDTTKSGIHNYQEPGVRVTSAKQQDIETNRLFYMVEIQDVLCIMTVFRVQLSIKDFILHNRLTITPNISATVVFKCH